MFYNNLVKLSDADVQFILANADKLTPRAISDALNLEYGNVYSFLKRNKIAIVKSVNRVPVQRKHFGEMFNVDAYMAESVTI